MDENKYYYYYYYWYNFQVTTWDRRCAVICWLYKAIHSSSFFYKEIQFNVLQLLQEYNPLSQLVFVSISTTTLSPI